MKQSNDSICIMETLGFSVALLGADRAIKAADVTLLAVDVNNPAKGEQAKITVSVQVKMAGSVSAVKEAADVFAEVASRYIPSEDTVTTVLANPSAELAPLLRMGKIQKKPFSGTVPDALAIIEVYTFAASVHLLDYCLKGSHATLISNKKTIGGRLSTLIIGGKIDAVREVIDISNEHSTLQPFVKSALMITNPSRQIMDFMQ